MSFPIPKTVSWGLAPDGWPEDDTSSEGSAPKTTWNLMKSQPELSWDSLGRRLDLSHGWKLVMADLWQNWMKNDEEIEDK